ncbi:hypothetical protein NMY22_g4087 [Coprinellus aureogranulatus]|nr:hypothetical protein NMY22_g4087 [Coprinellus aureogranulatus]
MTSPMRPPGRLVFDGVEVPKRAGVKRSRDSPSTISKRLDLSPRKRGRMRLRSPSMVSSSSIQDGTRSRADSPTASESFQSSKQGYPSSGIDTDASNQAQATPPKTSRAASRVSSFPSLDEGDAALYRYEVSVDEIPESADLKIQGEDPLSDSDDEEGDSDIDEERDVPVRLLDNFTIYNMHTFEVIPTTELLQGLGVEGFPCGCDYAASGEVRPWTEQSPEDASDDEVELGVESWHNRVRTTRITCFNVHHIEQHPVVDGPKLVTLDGKIYVCTQHAWYILGYPSQEYSAFFCPYWRMHRVTHLLLFSLLRNPKLDELAFCAEISTVDRMLELPSAATQILGRELDENDYHSEHVHPYLCSTLADLADELQIARTPLVRKLNTLFGVADDLPKVNKKHEGVQGSKEPRVTVKDRNHRINQTTTYTTPIVSNLSCNLFSVKMESHSKALEIPEADRCSKIAKAKIHKMAIDNFTLSKPIPVDSIQPGTDVGHEGYFSEVTIEGVLYKTGDIVMVIPDPDFNGRFNYGWSPNVWGNTMWFCQIKYFYETAERAAKFHAQWYLHGSKTILNELSHPLALYPVLMCNDISLDAIYQKCIVTFLKMGDPEPLDDATLDMNNFHSGLFYHHDFGEFTDFPPVFEDSLETPHCYSCQELQVEALKQTPTLCDGVLSYGGEAYHVGDFVYILPVDSSSESKLLHVCEVLGFDTKKPNHTPTVTIRHHKRHTELEKACAVEPFSHSDNVGLFFDERRLVLTSDNDMVVHDVSPTLLSGHCYIQQFKSHDLVSIENWIKHDDHFFTNSILDRGKLRRLRSGELAICARCSTVKDAELEQKQTFLASAKKLVGMELFAGAGGLGYGMELSGFVDTQYAVEFMPSAAKTFKKNHPHTTVFCQDTNSLLRYVVERDNGEQPNMLEALDGPNGSKCSEMPKKGDQIDFIFGGPPCQAFSRMNHSRRADDIRSTMPCNMLSYIEHYRPKYFLLENVVGILDYKLQDRRVSKLTDGKTIVMGMVKFIMRTLISLGYQVRIKQLQAAQYGVPQSRNRVIFIGAQRGLTLPSFPVPVYAFPKGGQRLKVLMNEHGGTMKIPTVSRWKGRLVNNDGKDFELFHQCAPFEMRTVFDAIGDLPAFDWKIPSTLHSKMSQKQFSELEDADKSRDWFGTPILRMDAVKSVDSHHPAGYLGGAEYATPPQNRYQQWLRRNMVVADEDRNGKGKSKACRGGDEGVTGHYTSRFGANQVERTVAVPLKPDAHHRDTPVSLWLDHAKPGGRQTNKAFFGRVGGNKYFKCAMTNMAPNLKELWPLHPLQRRIYTVRECARAQGFPDDYEFCSVYDITENPQKVIADQIKQIGNAVAVPFALALGKELGNACFIDWKAGREKDGSPEL